MNAAATQWMDKNTPAATLPPGGRTLLSAATLVSAVAFAPVGFLLRHVATIAAMPLAFWHDADARHQGNGKNDFQNGHNSPHVVTARPARASERLGYNWLTGQLKTFILKAFSPCAGIDGRAFHQEM